MSKRLTNFNKPFSHSLALYERLLWLALVAVLLRDEAAVEAVVVVVLARPDDGVVGQGGGVLLAAEVAPLLAVGALHP